MVDLLSTLQCISKTGGLRSRTICWVNAKRF